MKLDHTPRRDEFAQPGPSSSKEPWQRPTLETLDVSDTQAMPMMGGDGGLPNSTLS